MIALVNASCFVSNVEELQVRFLGILARIEQHARIAFRHVVCREKRADLVAETVALAWKWFARLAEQGKDATQFPSTLASYAARAVRSGRRVCDQLKSHDVLSERAQQRDGFVVGKLPDFSTESTNPLAEALADNTRSAVPAQVQFRCDFPAWRRTHCRRNRRVIGRLMLGERTIDVARSSARYLAGRGSPIVFACVDQIGTRRLIWESCRQAASLFIDGRMSAEVIRVLAVPEPAIDASYATTLFTAQQAYAGSCTAKATIYTASIAAGLMLAQFTRWLRRLPVDADVSLNLLSMELSVSAVSP